jgi:DNA-binding response OmpR family regulator
MNNKTVLICDDDEGIIEVTTIILEEKGYNVISMTSCETLFEKIDKFNPRVILLDLWMPDATGDEITRQLKADDKTKQIPIIIVSANKDTEKVAKESGADDFLCKPFDINELEDIVQKYSEFE